MNGKIFSNTSLAIQLRIIQATEDMNEALLFRDELQSLNSILRRDMDSAELAGI